MTESKIPMFDRMTDKQRAVAINYEEQELRLLSLFQKLALEAKFANEKLPAKNERGTDVVVGCNNAMNRIACVYLDAIESFMRYSTGEDRDRIQTWKREVGFK